MTGPRRRGTVACAAALLATPIAACTPADGPTILVVGSSTVRPLVETVADRGGFDVVATGEGSLEGFADLCSGRGDIAGASTPIPGAGAEVDYQQMCAANGVEIVELPIALDAITLVRHASNDFATDLTLPELHAIWGPYSQVRTWADVRPEWPAEPLVPYGRPEGSGTFEEFTRVVGGRPGLVRDDYAATDDPAELTGWLADDPGGLGFMSVGAYLAADEEDRTDLTNVAVDGELPSLEVVHDGGYEALSRPLFVYVAADALDEPEVVRFVEELLDSAADVAPRVYLYPLPDGAHPLVRARFDARVTGTMYAPGTEPGASVLELLGR